MIVSVWPGRPSGAIRDALLSHGWEGVVAGETAASLETCAFHVTGMAPETVEALLRVAPKYGLEVLTGEDWAVLSGTRSRLSAMARSWSLPESLRALAVPIGQGLPADAPAAWLVGGGAVDLTQGPVLLGEDVATSRFAECHLGRDGLAEAAARVEADGLGLVLRASGPASAVEDLAGALDELNRFGVAAERVAVDPRWAPGAADASRARALGRPVVCATDDPVLAVLAWERGAQLFECGAADGVRQALRLAAAFAA